MARAIRLEVRDADAANQLAARLRLNGLHAVAVRPLHGTPQVSVRKPMFRRMGHFLADVEAIVRRWLEEEAPALDRVAARAGRNPVEIVNPTADLPDALSRNSAG